MHRLRWVFIGLFLTLVLALFLLPVTRAFGLTWADTLHGLVFLAIFFGSQAMYIFGAGTLDLCRPIGKRRLWLPVAVGSAMLAILTGGMVLAAIETFFENRKNDDWVAWVFWSLLLGAWLGWGVLFWVYTQRIERFRALHWMTTWIVAGSMVELLAILPAHVFVGGRRGCLAFHGMMTGIGLMAGIVGLVWAFGPAVLLLTFSKRYQEERNARRAQRIVNHEGTHSGDDYVSDETLHP